MSVFEISAIQVSIFEGAHGNPLEMPKALKVSKAGGHTGTTVIYAHPSHAHARGTGGVQGARGGGLCL